MAEQTGLFGRRHMYQDLTKGSITKGCFSLPPMVAGNLLQQLYNIADTHPLS